MPPQRGVLVFKLTGWLPLVFLQARNQHANKGIVLFSFQLTDAAVVEKFFSLFGLMKKKCFCLLGDGMVSGTQIWILEGGNEDIGV